MTPSVPRPVKATPIGLFVVFLVPVICAILSLCLIEPYRQYQKDAALAARGIIKLTCQFVDRHGRLVQGQRDELPEKFNAAENSSDTEVLAMLRRPVIVYDRTNSQRNLLYPAVYAEIRR